MTEAVPSSALSEVSLRLLCHDDIDTVKHLCGDWFPIEYPDSWYRDITSNKKFFSLAATYRGDIVGMIVAEIKNRTKIHKEDGDILASSFSVDTQVAYILSLGVVKEFRKHGIGSLLLESLKDHISTTAQDHCKAIYLHVLTTNNTAISFYENRDFKQHLAVRCRRLPPEVWMTEAVPSSALSEVSLRLLCHDDIDTVKHLCGDWFPIEYPDSWYRDITSNKKFFSLAATYRGDIVGMIVAEIKNRTKIHKEDGDILASSFSVDTQVAYILSLGVVKEFRKHGIGKGGL